MTVIYRCDNCQDVHVAVTSGGSSPTSSGIYVSWHVDPDATKKGPAKHLCDRCLVDWFNTMAAKFQREQRP